MDKTVDQLMSDGARYCFWLDGMGRQGAQFSAGGGRQEKRTMTTYRVYISDNTRGPSSQETCEVEAASAVEALEHGRDQFRPRNSVRDVDPRNWPATACEDGSAFLSPPNGEDEWGGELIVCADRIVRERHHVEHEFSGRHAADLSAAAEAFAASFGPEDLADLPEDESEASDELHRRFVSRHPEFYVPLTHGSRASGDDGGLSFSIVED